jgi:cytosine/uracil/thiamine/allantoin permease
MTYLSNKDAPYGRRIASNVVLGGIQVKVSQMFSEKKARKWMWVGLVAFVALQVYFVQEMLAALLLFTGVFVIFAIGALAIYLVDRAGQWSLGWAGQRARPAVQLARRGWAAVEELSKKPFRRPRSETAQ